MIRYNGVEIDTKAMTIRHKGFYYQAMKRSPKHYGGRSGKKVQFKALSMLILSPYGVSYGQLFDRIYGEDDCGGPNAGEKIFAIAFSKWVPLFLDMHMLLRREKVSGVIRYRLVPA